MRQSRCLRWGRRDFAWGLALLLAAPAARAQPAGVAPVPRPRREKIPPAPPGDRYVWQPGTWEWLETEGRYDWRHGRYVARRPGTTTFIGGRWVQEAGVWVWRRGRWK